MNKKDCKFTKEHEWVYLEGDIATIGISDYASKELGDIVYIELPEPGTSVNQMDPVGTIEAVKTVAELFSPLTGEIAEINDEIVENPEIVNDSPFEQGWFIKIKIEDEEELDVLFSYDEYREFLGDE